MSAINNFDVLKEMGERELDIKSFPLGNIQEVNVIKKGTMGVVKILIDPETANILMADFLLGTSTVLGIFLIANMKQFNELKAELEAGNAT